MKDKKFGRYIVMGSHFGGMAHLHIVAASEEEAIAEYKAVFGNRVSGWDPPSAENLDENPHLAKHWKGHRYSHFSNGY